MALAAYRNLLRAARTAFQGYYPHGRGEEKKKVVIAKTSPWRTGDKYVLGAAFCEARRGFEVNRELSAESKEAQELVKQCYEVATVLRTNVVQGKLNDDGRYRMCSMGW